MGPHATLEDPALRRAEGGSRPHAATHAIGQLKSGRTRQDRARIWRPFL